jgi:hypothetical protein
VAAIGRQEKKLPAGLDDLAIEFSKAEARLKQAENKADRVPVSVVNELRYAGCHVLRALCPAIAQTDETDTTQSHDSDHPGESHSDAEVRRATDHCKRARYDAIEYETIQRLKKVTLFQEDYRLVISPEMPKVNEALQAAYDAQQMVEGEPGKDPDPRREKNLDALDRLCESLKLAERGLATIRPVLNIKLEDRQRQDRTSRRRWIATTIIAVLALLSASAIGITKIYLDAHKAAPVVVPTISPPSPHIP